MASTLQAVRMILPIGKRHRNVFKRQALRNCHAYTLIEMMFALVILGFIFTATVVSLRGKWQTEYARRGAQQIKMAWLKARSQAWRDGREWVVEWDAKASQFHAKAMEKPEINHGAAAEVHDAIVGLATFDVKIDSLLRISSEVEENETGAVHFFPNKRVRHASLLVTGPKGDVWRVKMDWAGLPVMEQVTLKKK